MTNHTDIYRLLFNEARDGIWIINPASRKVLEVNSELTVLSGYTRDELLSMPPQNISPDPEGTMQIMKKAMQEGGEIFAERLLKKKDGSIIPVEIAARSAAVGGQRLIFGIFRDIRERKKAEQEKTELIQKLEKALEEVKTLSGLLAICSNCRKIRDDKGKWNPLEAYIQKHSEAQFTHGLCPQCMDDLYGHESWYSQISKKSRKQ